MSVKPVPHSRNEYSSFSMITTRWMDNDVYGHVNNVNYYSYFDTAVNKHLIDQGALDIANSEVIGLVVETKCNYFAPLVFPQIIDAGIRVQKVGRSSVCYEIGLFAKGEETASAQGHFVHVYVDRASSKPVQLPTKLHQVVSALAVTL